MFRRIPDCMSAKEYANGVLDMCYRICERNGVELTESSSLNVTTSAIFVCSMFIDYLEATPAQILLFLPILGIKKTIWTSQGPSFKAYVQVRKHS